MKRILLFAILIIFSLSFMVIHAQEFSITIDAQKDAFYEALTGQENGLVFMPAACYLRDIGTGPDDDADLSAVIWMSWDEDYLYAYLEVKDDVVTASNSARYLNDCIELKFDPDPAVVPGSGTSNMRLTALGADNAEQPGGVDNINGSGNLVSVGGTKYDPFPDDYARRLTDDGYALEFRVPLQYINVPANNRFLFWDVNVVFGMAINIGDNDTGTRDNMLQWSAGHTDGVHSNPQYCGSVTFLEGNILSFSAVSPSDPSIVNDSAAVWYNNPNPTSVKSKSNPVESPKVLSNYPNPFNPETRIQYQIKQAETVTLSIYNVHGELIRNLAVDKYHAPGSYEITWDGKNDFSQAAVSSGIYFCRLTTTSMVKSQKMMLIK